MKVGVFLRGHWFYLWGAVCCVLLIGWAVYLIYEEPELNMTDDHYRQLKAVASYFEPYCGDEYQSDFRAMSEDGLAPNEVLKLLGISPKTYRFYRDYDDFLLQKLNCVGWHGGPFDDAGFLSELNSEISQGLYEKIDRYVGGVRSAELKSMLGSMLDKGYLSILDFYLLEVRYKRVKKEEVVSDLKSKASI